MRTQFRLSIKVVRCWVQRYIVNAFVCLNLVMLLIYRRKKRVIYLSISKDRVIVLLFYFLFFSVVCLSMLFWLGFDVNNCTFCIQYKCASQWQEKHKTTTTTTTTTTVAVAIAEKAAIAVIRRIQHIHDYKSNVCWLCVNSSISQNFLYRFSIFRFFLSSCSRFAWQKHHRI